jgi:hypothetical protein
MAAQPSGSLMWANVVSIGFVIESSCKIETQGVPGMADDIFGPAQTHNRKNFAQSNFSMQDYDDLRFRSQVDLALKRIKMLLDNERNPQYPADVFHQYDDKYLLVDFITNRYKTMNLYVITYLVLWLPRSIACRS